MHSHHTKLQVLHKQIRKQDLFRRLGCLREKTQRAFRHDIAFERLDCPERLAEEYAEYMVRKLEEQGERKREQQAREQELAQMYLQYQFLNGLSLEKEGGER